ncbi:MAG: hypothetical protein JST10_01795, partial [Bacteroidetes bacterium]|nr:hypothetical protein [Bacteroidota bacterium]
MKLQTNTYILLNMLGKKLTVLVLLAVTAGAAFATLGDGKAKTKKSKKSLLSSKMALTPGTFSLKSGYSFRGSEVIAFEKDRYININTVITYQKGNSTYILPLKKKLLLD